MTRSWCARCNRRRVFPPECQRRQQFGASGDRASPPNRSRSPRHRPRLAPRRAARRAGPRRSPGASGAVADVPEGDVAAAGRADDREWWACCADSTLTWCIWRRRRCSATAACTPPATSASRPLPYSKRTSRVSPRATASASQPRRPGRGRATCTAAPTAPWRRRRRRWKTLPPIASRGSTGGHAASTSPASRRRRATMGCAADGRRTGSRSWGSSAGSRRKSMSSGWRGWRGVTTFSS